MVLNFLIRTGNLYMTSELENKTALFIPTLNGGIELTRFLASLESSSFRPAGLLAIDSGSSDDTEKQLKSAGFLVDKTDKKTFTHGRVRRNAVKKLKDFEYVIMVTQDVELSKNAIFELVSFIDKNRNIGVAYGKQTAIQSGDTFSQDDYDKSINYPDQSLIKSISDKSNLGIKTVFSSDAFSVYRVDFVKKIGSFPDYVKFSEDMYMAAKFILNGYEVGYCAEAQVHHTNTLPRKKLFDRYRQIGQFHRQFPWIQKEFGKAEGAGISLVIKQLKGTFKRKDFLGAINVVINSGIKYIAFKSTIKTPVTEEEPPYLKK